MSQNPSVNGSKARQSTVDRKQKATLALEHTRLSRRQTRILDSNSNSVDLTMTNPNKRPQTTERLTQSRQVEGADGPESHRDLRQEPKIQSYFSIQQPPRKTFPSNPKTTMGNPYAYHYYRPHTAPAASLDRNLTERNVYNPVPSALLNVESSTSLITSRKPLHTKYYLENSESRTGILEVSSSRLLNPKSSRWSESKNKEGIKDGFESCPRSACSKREESKEDGTNRKGTKRRTVRFAPGTMIIDRESKPSKLRSPKKNRKPKFAHPCCGHFLPPESEISYCVGPEGGYGLENPYVKYTLVWNDPSDRKTNETAKKWLIRKKRFYIVLKELSEAHNHYNVIADEKKLSWILEQIIPRYAMAMDLSLMDGDMVNAERLMSTMSQSIRVLQGCVYDIFFDSNHQPKIHPQLPRDSTGYLSILSPVVFALNRLSGSRVRQEVDHLPIEPLLVKLQFELLSLMICPVRSGMFKCLLQVIPITNLRVLRLFRDIRRNKDKSYYIKWVNDSVMHRDYMALMKEFKLSDENGAKSDVPPPRVKNNINVLLRPVSAI